LGLAKNIVGNASIEFGEATHLSQKKFAVPIKAKVSGEMFSTEIAVQFETDVLNLTEIKLDEKFSDYSEAHNLNDGVLSISLAGMKPIVSIADLISLTFEAKDPEAKHSTVLSMLEATMNEGQISVNISKGSLLLQPALSTTHQLEQNYPNPFNPTTTIGYSLARPAEVRLTIFDVNGKEVKQLVHETKPAGYYLAERDTTDKQGMAVSSGIYFYRIQILESEAAQQPFANVKKMVLTK